MGLTRRRILFLAPLGLGGCSRAPLPSSESSAEVTIIQFDDHGSRVGSVRVARIVRTDEEWAARLTPAQFYVTRQARTDVPFTGTYYRMHDHGVFRCVCCGTALFSSSDKYDSGTGWPAFRAPIALENLRREKGGVLFSGIEVQCRLCEAHLGHIFDDGPAPAHLRYCINESALRFAPV